MTGALAGAAASDGVAGPDGVCPLWPESGTSGDDARAVGAPGAAGAAGAGGRLGIGDGGIVEAVPPLHVDSLR